VTSLVAAALLLVAGTLFTTYLGTDPEGFARAAGSALLAGLLGAAVWCTSWALLSKTFTRQARFGWHLRVFVFASLALLAVGALPALLAFAFSWPWLTDFDFVGAIVVIAAALYFHLLAVEPARHRMLKWAAVTCALVGVLVAVWFNVQRSDQFGDELYMSHLFPPAVRLARPVAVDAFVDGLAPLQATLDRKAKEPARGDEGTRGDDE
jgi:MFS family permease